MSDLPEILVGHWETAEGLAMAEQYARRSRATLALGERSDLALANAVFLIDRNSLELGLLQTAARERIRWLSVQLAIAHAALRSLKCGSCGGSGQYLQRDRRGSSCVPCKVCEGTGEHPTARAALSRDLGGGR